MDKKNYFKVFFFLFYIKKEVFIYFLLIKVKRNVCMFVWLVKLFLRWLVGLILELFDN